MKRLAIICICSATLASCSADALINESTHVENGRWAYHDVRRLSVEVSDTLTPFNYYVQIRHGGNYAYQNLIVYFKTYYPDNTYKIDTVDCPLADKSGRWYGNGLGDLLDTKVMFKRNVQFSQSGNHHFEIQHAMRLDTIDEIYDIGLLIESAID